MGATAEEAYVRMIDLVTLAEKRLAKATRKIFPGATLPKAIATAAEVAPILRGLLSLPAKSGGREAAQRFVFEFRSGPEILAYVAGKEIGRYSQQGPVTPDHAIRTKPAPLILPAPEAGKLDAFKAEAKKALDAYVADYHAYFARHNVRQMPSKTELDPDAARRAGAGLGLFGRRQHAPRTPRSPPTSPRPRSRSWPTPSGSAPTSAFPSPTFSTSNTGRSNRPSWAPRPRSRWRAALSSSPAAARASAPRPRQAFAREGAEVVVLDREVCQGQGLRDRLRRH